MAEKKLYITETDTGGENVYDEGKIYSVSDENEAKRLTDSGKAREVHYPQLEKKRQEVDGLTADFRRKVDALADDAFIDTKEKHDQAVAELRAELDEKVAATDAAYDQAIDEIKDGLAAEAAIKPEVTAEDETASKSLVSDTIAMIHVNPEDDKNVDRALQMLHHRAELLPDGARMKLADDLKEIRHEFAGHKFLRKLEPTQRLAMSSNARLLRYMDSIEDLERLKRDHRPTGAYHRLRMTHPAYKDAQRKAGRSV